MTYAIPPQLTPFDPTISSQLFDDFIGGGSQIIADQGTNGTSCASFFNRVISGAGASITRQGGPATINSPGILTLNTGTTAAGIGGILSDNTQGTLFGGDGSETIEWRARFLTLSTVGIEEYFAQCGLLTGTVNQPDNTSHLYFLYNRNSSVNWLLSSGNGGNTQVDSGIPVANNLFQKLKIVTSSDGLSASFYIDGVFVGVLATNMPTGGANGLRIGAQINKVVGVTTRQMEVDYCNFFKTFTTPR